MFPKIKKEELSLGQGDINKFKDEEDLDFLDKTDKYDFPMKDDKQKIPKAKAKPKPKAKPVNQTLDIDPSSMVFGRKRLTNSTKIGEGRIEAQ